MCCAVVALRRHQAEPAAHVRDVVARHGAARRVAAARADAVRARLVPRGGAGASQVHPAGLEQVLRVHERRPARRCALRRGGLALEPDYL